MSDRVRFVRRTRAALLTGLLLSSFAAIAGAEGQLDTRFGPAHNGKATVGFNIDGGLVDMAFGAAAQSDGRLIVAGHVLSGTPQLGIGLVRLNASGYADTSFGGHGTGQTTLFLSNNAKVAGVLVQSDDRILVYGTTQESGDSVMFAMRFLPDGTVDTSWGNSGLAVVHPASLQLLATDAVPGPGGSLYLAGYTHGGNIDFAAAKLTATGSLDASFGVRTVAFDNGGNNTDQAESAALQSDGKLLLAGQADTGGNTSKFALARLDGSSGALDSSFGNLAAGRSLAPIPGGFNGCINEAAGLAVYGYSASQRTLLVGGTHCRYDVAATAAVVAFDNGGQLVSSFGSGGVATVSIYPTQYQSGEITAMQMQRPPIQPGLSLAFKLVLSGGAQFKYGSQDWDMVSMRLGSDGSLDSTYGNNGYQVAAFDVGGDKYDYANGALLTGGYLYQVGSAAIDSGNRDFAIACLLVGDRIMANGFDPFTLPPI